MPELTYREAVRDALIQAMLDRDLFGTLILISSAQEPAVVGSEAGETALGTIMEGLGFSLSAASPLAEEQRRKC